MNLDDFSHFFGNGFGLIISLAKNSNIAIFGKNNFKATKHMIPDQTKWVALDLIYSIYQKNT